MRKFLTAVVFGLYAIACQAEASFEQIEGLIQQKNYAAAASGLEGIIQNHPKSAKAFYAMAQAQAGLGNLEKANKALTIATGLNPSLDFAPEGSVRKLKEAITPQTAKIEQIEETHFWRNFSIAFVLFAGGGLIIALLLQKRKEEAEMSEKLAAQAVRQEREAEARRMTREREEERQRQAEEQAAKEKAAEDALKAHKNYGKAGFDPANPDKLKTKKQLKDEADQAAEKQRLFFEAEAKREAQARADAAEATARMYRTSAQTVAPTHTTVVNNSSNDMLTGIMVGSMLSGSHHDTTRVVEREVIREVPAPSRSSRDSSWDDIPSTSSSRSSSWDDTPSRSSSSSSSWDSGSSSSSSSSSWDSGSSSSSSDSGSSSSWD